MKRTGFPNEGSLYVSGVETLTTEAALKKMSPEERAKAEKELEAYHAWIDYYQLREQDARYQTENPENTLK
jgi:hypothetical protein